MRSTIEAAKLVIFDMDGTILDSEPLHARAIQTVFRECNIEMSVQEIMDRYVGWGDDNVYKDKTELQSKMTRDQFISRKDEIIEDVVGSMSTEDFKSLFAKDFFKFLDFLVEKKIKTSLVSASERLTVDLFLEKANIKEKFQYSLTRDEVFKSKPSPGCYLEAMRKMGTKSVETIIFEDSDHGIKSALGSGAKVFAMNLSQNDKQTLKMIENRQLQCNGNYSWLF